jgi:uncharacterized protein with PIN domain
MTLRSFCIYPASPNQQTREKTIMTDETLQSDDEAFLDEACANCSLTLRECSCAECPVCFRLTHIIKGVIEQNCQHCGAEFWDEGLLNEVMLEKHRERH